MKTPVVLLFALAMPSCGLAAGPLTIVISNTLPIDRAQQTIELSSGALEPLGERDLRRVHVQDAAGTELLCQAVDTNYDELHAPDEVIFQADFAPGEVRTFRVNVGGRQEYTKSDFKAYGRFVRERFDDFAWENDRIAHRTYGRALETWKGEPLTSSAIDVWSKRTPALVIDQWYMVDNYHADTGEGCDDYSAGTSRGCGGTGFWADNRLWVSRNFVDSRVLANGPIRVLFELVYDPFDVNGKKVSEVKRISLDAGSQLDHFRSLFKTESGAGTLTPAVGFKKVAGARKEFNVENGWLTIWEPMEKNMGKQGLAAVLEPGVSAQLSHDKLNDLLLIDRGGYPVLEYWAGFAWDKAGRFTTPESWKQYVDTFSQSVRSPLRIVVLTE